jgi:hypothetical protein
MAEKPGAQMDWLQRWVDMQETLWQESMAAMTWGRRMLSAMPLGRSERGVSEFTLSELFKGCLDLSNYWSNTMGLAFAPQMPGMLPAFMQLYEIWMKWWQGREGPAARGSWCEEFTNRLKESFGEKGEDGPGRTVFKGIISSVEIYFDVLNFWAKTLSASPDLVAGKPLPQEKVKELHEQWVRNYRSLVASLWGSAPSTTQERRS